MPSWVTRALFTAAVTTSFQARRHGLEGRRRTGPSQLVNIVEEGNVSAQRRERAEQQRPIALLYERFRQPRGVRRIGVPLAPILRNLLQMAKSGQYRGSRFRAPARQSRIPIRRVAHEREVVGNRRRFHAELLDDTRFVELLARAALQLHDARAADALREILLGCP